MVENIKIRGTKKRTTKVRVTPEYITEIETEEGNTVVCFYLEISWHSCKRKALVPIPKPELSALEANTSEEVRLNAKLVIKGANLLNAQVGLRFENGRESRIFWQQETRELCGPSLTAINKRDGGLTIIPTSAACSVTQIQWDPERKEVTIFNHYEEPVLKLTIPTLKALLEVLQHIQKRVETLKAVSKV